MKLSPVAVIQHQETLEYLDKALEIAIDIGDRGLESTCYGNIGASYLNLGQHQKALQYSEKSLAIKRDLGDITHLSRIYRILALIYQRNNPDKAFEYLADSINLSDSMSAMLVEEVQ